MKTLRLRGTRGINRTWLIRPTIGEPFPSSGSNKMFYICLKWKFGNTNTTINDIDQRKWWWNDDKDSKIILLVKKSHRNTHRYAHYRNESRPYIHPKYGRLASVIINLFLFLRVFYMFLNVFCYFLKNILRLRFQFRNERFYTKIILKNVIIY